MCGLKRKAVTGAQFWITASSFSSLSLSVSLPPLFFLFHTQQSFDITMFWFWVAEISTVSMLDIYTPSYSSAFNKLTGELSEFREVFTDIIFKGSCH